MNFNILYQCLTCCTHIQRSRPYLVITLPQTAGSHWFKGFWRKQNCFYILGGWAVISDQQRILVTFGADQDKEVDPGILRGLEEVLDILLNPSHNVPLLPDRGSNAGLFLLSFLLVRMWLFPEPLQVAHVLPQPPINHLYWITIHSVASEWKKRPFKGHG